jgi:hypothetical protein
MYRLFAAVILLAMSLQAARPQEELKWSELGTLSGRTIRIVMPDKAVIGGKLTTAEPDGLVLQIKNTTNKNAYPKGRFVVPRAQVKAFEVLSRGKRFRTIGTICGAWFGLGLGTYAAFHTNSAGAAIATLGAVGAGSTLLGYYLGDAADKKGTTIVIRD